MTKRTNSTKKSHTKSARKPAGKQSHGVDPTSEEALRALPADYAVGPDIPVKVAQLELASLARLAKTAAGTLLRVGITALQIETLQRFAVRLGATESAWQKARVSVSLTAVERRRLAEAEELDKKLLAGGRWACRKDSQAQAELGRIAEGSGLTDTIQDLRDLVSFWEARPDELACTDITAKDLARATELADALTPAAEKEDQNLTAAAALDLRNRCFWAADELARELREGGRYAFRLQPKTAAKFASRYRLAALRRSRRKSQEEQPPASPPTA